MIPIAAIQEEVARAFRIPVAKMTEPINRGQGKDGRNAREYYLPRQIAMYLATILTDHSMSRIGDYFGHRDHSTVISGIRSVERRIEKDAFLAAKVKNAAARLQRVDNSRPALVSRQLEAA